MFVGLARFVARHRIKTDTHKSIARSPGERLVCEMILEATRGPIVPPCHMYASVPWGARFGVTSCSVRFSVVGWSMRRRIFVSKKFGGAISCHFARRISSFRKAEITSCGIELRRGGPVFLGMRLVNLEGGKSWKLPHFAEFDPTPRRFPLI